MAEFAPNARPLPTVVSTPRGPENVDTNRVIADIADELFYYMPSKNPFLTLSSRLKNKRTVTQRYFGWLVKDEYPRVIELSAAALVADVTLPIIEAHATFSANNFIYRNTRTEELVLVTSDGGTATITVTRGFAGSTQADMEAGDKLTYVATAFEDGSGAGTKKSTKEVFDYNYCHIAKTDYGWTGRQLHTDLYGGTDMASERKSQAIEHAKSLEKLVFAGGRSTQTGSGGHELTTMGGLNHYVQTNIWDLDGTRPTERTFVEFLEEAMKWGKGGNLTGSGTKVLFTSARWTTELEFFAKDKLRYSPEMKKIGLDAREYVTAHGRVLIVPNHILDEDFKDRAYLIDPNHVRPVVHQGRDTKIMKNTQAPDIDGENEQILTDFSLQVELEASHAILKGLDLT